MRKLKLYLDTSFISHLYQPDAPDKMADSSALWNDILSGEYEALVSEVTTAELEDAPEPKLSIVFDYLSEAGFEVVREIIVSGHYKPIDIYSPAMLKKEDQND